MKTPEEILESEFATQNLTGMVRDGVIKAMEEYAREAEDNYSHFWEDAHAKLEEKLRDEYEGKLRDEQLQNTHLAQKCSDLADENISLVEENRFYKEETEINCNCNADGCLNANLLYEKDLKIEKLNDCIDRLENDLTEAVEIMSSIYHNVDKYHLSISFKNGELFDKLKDYLGV